MIKIERTKVLKQLIEDSGLNLKAFSEKAGIPYTTLRSMLERGIGNASVDNVIKICRVLNITIEDLDNVSMGEVEVGSTNNGIGDRIKQLRQEKGLTQDALALSVNSMFESSINKGMVSKWENNKEQPSIENIRNLSMFFNCSVDHIINISSDKKIDESSIKEDPSITELKNDFEELFPRIADLSRNEKEKLIKMIDIYLD